MRWLDASSEDFRQAMQEVLAYERELELSVEKSVLEIIKAVEQHGDHAVVANTLKYDGLDVLPSAMRIRKATLSAAWNSLGPRMKTALTLASDRITEYAKREIESGFTMVDEVGMRMERRIVPLKKAGIHISSGQGQTSYPVSLLMGVIPAKVAGVKEVIVCCGLDPKDTKFNSLLAAAHLSKADRFYRVGGVQAIAAMAFGTQSIPKVDVIAGWGNLYEATAKKLLQGIVGTDSFAGPNEICIIADRDSDPAIIAADLLAQAEHSVLSRCFLVSTDKSLADKTLEEIEKQLPQLPKVEIAKAALENQGAIILAGDIETAIDVTNEIAPEHLIISTNEEERVAAKITRAGAIFIGQYTPEALGDYIAGPNHTLPTGGTARFDQALSTRDFCKAINVMRASRGALARLGPTSIILAEAEGLQAHAEAVKKRMKKLQGD